MPNKHSRLAGFLKGISILSIFVVAGSISFALGIRSSGDIKTVERTSAGTPTTAMVNVILQYQPVSGGAPKPIDVTPFMNSSQTALVHLQEIHTGNIVPANPLERCRTTNSLGRCTIRGVPVGPDSSQNIAGDQQYDVLVDTVFIEFLTGIAIDSGNAHVRYDPASCDGSATNFSAGSWCLTKQGGQFASEYFLTVSLAERNDCTESVPPAAFCDPRGKLTSFSCNPSFVGATRPWEPKSSSCAAVQCPDGNFSGGVCADISQQFAACSTAAACRNHPLCSVSNFSSQISYNAGAGVMVIRGSAFGNAGGTVSFPAANNRKEIVEIYPGADWTNGEIHVRVPQSAVSGILEIHPNTHGFTEQSDGTLLPVSCVSPPATIRSQTDQYAILSVQGIAPDGIRLVAPGFMTRITLLARHNDSISRLETILIELLDGSHPNVNALPINRTVIADASCVVASLGGANVKEAVLPCDIAIPLSASAFVGPFTFLATLVDDQGNAERAVLLDAGMSVIAGDMTRDGTLTVEDAALARKLATGTAPMLDAHRMRDTDGDGAITMTDVLFILHSLTK